MGEYFPDLPSRTLGQMGSVDYNPVKLTAESLDSRWAVGYLWGRSNGTGGEHPLGLALDFSVLEYRTPTVGGPARMWMGDAIARFLWTHRKRLGVWYIIWNRRIISTNRHSYAFNAWVEYRGSNPHVDHVHVSFYAANVYQPPAPPKPPEEIDMGAVEDLKEYIDAKVEAQTDNLRAYMAQRTYTRVNDANVEKYNYRQGLFQVGALVADSSLNTRELLIRNVRLEAKVDKLIERGKGGALTDAELDEIEARVAAVIAELCEPTDVGTVPEDADKEPKS